MHASAEVASRIIGFASADGAPIACPDDKVPPRVMAGDGSMAGCGGSGSIPRVTGTTIAFPGDKREDD
jgi:hypothetical protein